jgi:hypothetical protein
MIVACCFMVASLVAQSHTALKQPSITLDAPTGWDLQEHVFDARGNLLPEAPANFRRLGEVKAGEIGAVHTLTLRFTETLKLTQINLKSSRDFRIEQGGSCVQGSEHAANTTCTLLVRFTPAGAGNRVGHLLISGQPVSGSQVTTYAFGIGGYGYSPVVSFIPSVINTVPASYPANVGLLSGAQNLAVDGGDTLWVSDTGNNVVRNLDSSGNFKTLASGYSAPWGITVDTFGQAYFSRPAAGTINEIYDYGPVVQINGTGTGACPASTPCTLGSHTVTNPGALSMDPYNHMFFTESTSGGALSTVQPIPANLIFLYDPFPFQTNPQSPAAMDAGDNIYSLWSNGGTCSIVQQSLYNAENSNVSFNKIVGGHTCGFSGDGGLAGNAEIGASVGQIVFDAAGDMYFSDTANQRVRRVDYVTGVIRTIAGNGTAGYGGDGAKATAAMLSTPTGLGVNSQGSVYIISSATTGQVIRQVGPGGYLAFPNQGKGKASAAQLVTVTNTGNSTMTLTNVVITGTNPADFKIDNTTTNCVLTTGAFLNSGQTCSIGVIFTPAAVGARKATLTLLDNTITGADSVTLSGTGVLPSPTFKITVPVNGATFTSGTPVTFSASVTSTSGAQPTGTVQFKVDGANYGSPVTVSGTGTASTSVTGLTTTTHTLSATYSGDSNYAAAGPVSVSITVKAAAILKFTSPTAGQTVPAASLPITVTVTSKVSPVPIGNVTFSVDGKQVGAPVKLVSGSASMTTAGLTVGSHTILAVYSGDKYHRATKASETVNAQ